MTAKPAKVDRLSQNRYNLAVTARRCGSKCLLGSAMTLRSQVVHGGPFSWEKMGGHNGRYVAIIIKLSQKRSLYE